MPFLSAIVALVAASMVYVYRFRGNARYQNVAEYFRKGWPIFSPFNCVLYMTTLARGSAAIIDPAKFPELDLLRQNWQTIRNEGLELVRLNYFDATKRPGTSGYFDIGFHSFFKYGWSHFYLTWYGYTHHSARRLCPRTVEILRRVPAMHGAMFAYLPKGSQLTRHADPLAICLRYHLGLATPNSDACFINVDGRNLSWRDGEVLMFDETYLHYVRNDTEVDRLILMCDVRRPLNPLGRLFNFFYRGVTRASVVPNTLEDQRGLGSRAFEVLTPLLARSKSLKSANRRLYRLIKWSLTGIVLLLLLSVLTAGAARLFARLVREHNVRR